jgi:hypothetical protein
MTAHDRWYFVTRRLYSWAGIVAGVLWLLYGYAWFSLGLPDGPPALRWEKFWAKMWGGRDGVFVLVVGYLILTGSCYFRLLLSARNRDSYLTIALLLMIASGISATLIPLLALPICSR